VEFGAYSRQHDAVLPVVLQHHKDSSMIQIHKEILQKNCTGNAYHPFVSVIIPAYNEEKHIRKCLESINNLNYPSDLYEIILVDNGSTDKTVEIAKHFTELLFVCPELNISGLRNYGAKKARGEIYAFIDADCVADADWLNIAVKSMKEDECVTGAYCQISPDPTWVEKTWGLRIPQGRREVPHLGAANLIVRAGIFNTVGGFDEKLKTGEDYEFCVRVKKIAKVILDDRIKVTHYGNPKTIKEFMKREIWHGLGAFGSVRLQVLDKPLIGTVIFIALTLIQVISFTRIMDNTGRVVFLNATIGILILLFITAFYKNNKINSIAQFLMLVTLFYFYYLSRSISFGYLIINKSYGRKK